MKWIEGTIHPDGCWLGERDGKWEVGFYLKPWREAGGPLVAKQLCVIVYVANESKAEAQAQKWSAGDNVRVPIRRLDKPKRHAHWFASAAAKIERMKPEAMPRKSKKVRNRRVVVDDHTLGRLALNRAMGWLEGMRTFRRREYEVMVVPPDAALDPVDERKLARAVRKAALRVKALDHDLVRVRDAIAEELVDVYNDTWRQQRRPLSPASFIRRLTLDSVMVAPRRTTAYFGAGEMFHDHGVEARISARGHIQELLIS